LRFAPKLVEAAMERTRDIASNTFQEYFDEDPNVGFTACDSMGLTDSHGLIFLENDHLKIEHQTADALVGLLKTSVKETVIPLTDIVSITLERKFLSAELVLQSRSLKTFGQLPGAAAGTLRLKINRPSNAAAQCLVREVRQQKST
jgi:hypothetical protein